jgi:hypothetical protein
MAQAFVNSNGASPVILYFSTSAMSMWNYVHCKHKKFASDPSARVLAWGGGGVKVKYRPWWPLGLREVEAPTFLDIRLKDESESIQV